MRVIRRLSRLLLPGLTMFLLFCGSASASWIRFLLVEDLRPGHPDMQVIEQSWGETAPGPRTIRTWAGSLETMLRTMRFRMQVQAPSP